MTLQQESAKRSALEQRMHSQLLLQAETMIAMEVKLLRLEAKVEKREAAQRRRTGSGFNFIPSSGINTSLGGISGTGNSSDSLSRIGGGIASAGSVGIASPTQPTATSSILSPDPRLTLPTISAIHTHPHDTIDEEENEFEKMEIQVTSPPSHHPQPARIMRGSSATRPPDPTNFAVVSSGASLASAVTATSFLDGEETHDVGGVVLGGQRYDGASARSDDGDVEDEGDSRASSEFM